MKHILCVIAIAAFIFSVSAAEYDRILSEMNQIIDANSGYVQMIDIGKNDQGNTIYGLRIENPNYTVEEGTKIPQLLVGAHHGNERSSADLCLVFARNLLLAMKNPQHEYYKALSRSLFYVVPVLNISGFNANSRSERDRYGNYVDPNRDYPDACVKNSYYRLTSIQNLVSFIERNNIVGSVTVHGYIGTFTFPWGIYTNNTKTLDHSFYSTIAGKAVKANNYRTGTHTDVIYAAVGSYEDWAYHKYGIWTMLLELARSANLEKDSQCVLIYFSQLPGDRSSQHQHTGQCTQTEEVRGEEFASRP